MKPEQILEKEKAFAEREDERSIGIRYGEHDFEFTRRWFKYRNQSTFSTCLLPKFDGTSPVRLLQIGVFEGMDLVWQMQNTLRHPDSSAVGIDPWDATTKLDSGYMSDVEARARHNLSPWASVQLIRGFSQQVMPIMESETFDLIIVDGDHDADPVYVDAINSFRLVKRGGWIVFDDVRNRVPKKNHVKHGLERFLLEHGDSVSQVWSHRYCECVEKL